MSGRIEKAKGRAKQAIGKTVGSRRMVREGRREELSGDAKNKLARLKRAIEDKLDEKMDELEDDRGRGRANG